MAQEMSLGMYLQSIKNLSHREAMEFNNMLEDFKDPWYPIKTAIYMGLFMVISMFVFTIVMRLLL